MIEDVISVEMRNRGKKFDSIETKELLLKLIKNRLIKKTKNEFNNNLKFHKIINKINSINLNSLNPPKRNNYNGIVLLPFKSDILSGPALTNTQFIPPSDLNTTECLVTSETFHHSHLDEKNSDWITNSTFRRLKPKNEKT